MYDNYCLYFKLKAENGILEILYEEKNNDSVSNYTSFISVPTRIFVSDNFVFLMSGHWCHWCMLSITE